MPHPNFKGGFKSAQEMVAAQGNPLQQVVDSATTAMATGSPTMGRRSKPDRSKGNGRNEAITRRLARMQKNSGR